MEISPALPQEAAQVRWYDVGSPNDDHKLERADLPGQSDTILMRKKGNPQQMYTTKAHDPSEWQCVKCGTVVLAAQVAHPIHDGPFPLSGSGQCFYETAPYCPNCEEQPGFDGSFITVS